MATSRLLGRTTAATGAPEEITVGAGLTFSGGQLSASGGVTLGTPVASTSGTAIDFTGLPSTVKRITVMLSGVSHSGSSGFRLQVGDSGGIESGPDYINTVASFTASAVATSAGLTEGFNLTPTTVGSGSYYDVRAVLTLLDGSTNYWQCVVNGRRGDAVGAYMVVGFKTLSDTLDRVRVTANGSDTFDLGKVNIIYE